MSFAEISTQPHVIAALKSAIEKNHLAHTLLFQGSSSSGKRRVAESLAKVLLCEKRSSEDACGVCRQCVLAAQKSHPDLYILEPNKDSPTVIKIEDVRNLITRANFKPFMADTKVFLIDPADTMNDVSQNALLKTLEEPWAGTFFILITQSPEKILPTIRSRAQVLNFLPVRMEREEDPLFENLKKEILKFILYEIDMPIFNSKELSPASIHLKAPDLSKLERVQYLALFDFLIEYFRDVYLIREGAKDVLGLTDYLPEKERFAKLFSRETLQDRIELFAQLKESVQNKINLKLAALSMWSKLIEEKIKVNS